MIRLGRSSTEVDLKWIFRELFSGDHSSDLYIDVRSVRNDFIICISHSANCSCRAPSRITVYVMELNVVSMSNETNKV